jgi:hypothetical protein
MMSARFLAWYTCGVLSLASLLISFVSVSPDATVRFAVLQAIFLGAAFVFAVIASVLTRSPAGHWGNRSLTVRCLLAVAAACSSLLMAVSVG